MLPHLTIPATLAHGEGMAWKLGAMLLPVGIVSIVIAKALFGRVRRGRASRHAKELGARMDRGVLLFLGGVASFIGIMGITVAVVMLLSGLHDLFSGPKN